MTFILLRVVFLRAEDVPPCFDQGPQFKMLYQHRDAVAGLFCLSCSALVCPSILYYYVVATILQLW